jgi:uncharacterized protein (DUF1786 family)
VRNALDAARIVKSRTMLGSPGAKEVQRMLKERARLLATERAWLKARNDGLASARKKLETAIQKLRR